MSKDRQKHRKCHPKQIDNDNSSSKTNDKSTADLNEAKSIAEPIRIKVLTLGSIRVGKSCFVKKYCEKNRFESSYVPTIGVDYGVKHVTRDMVNTSSLSIKIDFFDLSGELIRIGLFSPACHRP